MVKRCRTYYYLCKCNECGKTAIVQDNINIYNGAQAVRSLGWSFGKDGKTVKCDMCRNYRFNARRING